MPSRKVFVCGKPQMKTTTLRMIQGSQGRSVSEARPEGRAGLAESCSDSLTSSPEVALPVGRASDSLQIRFGCHNFRNTASAAMETIDATTSTNHGPWKFETMNCGIAKQAPATR